MLKLVFSADDGKVHIVGSADTTDAAATSVDGVHTKSILELQDLDVEICDIAFGWKHVLAVTKGHSADRNP